MRRRCSVLAASGALFVVAYGPRADALTQPQGLDTTPPLPNVLILMDTSGSFEHMINGSLPENDPAETNAGQCTMGPGGTGAPSIPNRWGALIQALTGSVQPYYACVAQPRTSGSPFDQEYSLNVGGVVHPYDLNYYTPFHRPVSSYATSPLAPNPQGCVYGPGQLPGAASGEGAGISPVTNVTNGAGGNATDFPSTAVGQYDLFNVDPTSGGIALKTCNATSSTNCSSTNQCNGGFQQYTDGSIDTNITLLRFALMTFDNDPDPGVGIFPAGIDPTSSTVLSTPNNPFQGQWSYFYNWVSGPVVPPQLGGPPAGVYGRLPNCSPIPFELGARSPAAPPWEGRLVGFPSSTGTATDVETSNLQVQQAVVSMRPFGATPLAAMFDDARYYLWSDPNGPFQNDDFVNKGNCRPQYVILITDGAPNDDLRPQCQGGPNGQCPYDTPQNIAADLYGTGTVGLNNGAAATAQNYAGTVGNSVTTFVIGFAVSQFTDPNSTPPVLSLTGCQSWADSLNGGNPPTLSQVNTACASASTSGHQACCTLEQIAIAGSGGAPPVNSPTPTLAYFADTPGALQAALQSITSQIAVHQTTRTVPVLSPTIAYGTGNQTSSTFLASFNPNSAGWSGDIQRTRTQCPGPTAQPVAGDDDFSADLVNGVLSRQFFTVNTSLSQQAGTTLPPSQSLWTIRPYYTSNKDVPAMPVFNAATVQLGPDKVTIETNLAPISGSTTVQNLLGLTPTSCEDPNDNPVFYLSTSTCATMLLDFLMAQKFQPTGDPGNPNPGLTLVSGDNYWNPPWPPGNTTSTPTLFTYRQTGSATLTTSGAPVSGGPLGGIFHATPAVVAPPTALLRDESYQAFRKAFGDTQSTLSTGTRPPVLYSATTDGLFHAFQSDIQAATAKPNELWSFIPPAILPGLRSNYPSLGENLLDGHPVAKDVVFSRTSAQLSDGFSGLWHTVVVASLGSNGPGYFALDVTDPSHVVDAGGLSGPSTLSGPALISTFFASAPQSFTPPFESMSTAPNPPIIGNTGPQFLWQWTIVPKINGSSPANEARLFGTHTGTPAITTLLVTDPDTNVTAETGVAILPGGSDSPPVNPSPGTCPRNAPIRNPAAFVDYAGQQFAITGQFKSRANVRQWGTSCSSGVTGRSLTIVRLDNGEILRVFGFGAVNSPTSDLPQAIVNPSPGSPRFTDVGFDSPITGTPVVYPGDVGSVAKELFVSDADGTMWKFNVSDPNPANWKGGTFLDAFNQTADTGANAATDGEPVQVTPILALDPSANLSIIFGTGDQDTLSQFYCKPGAVNCNGSNQIAIQNFVYSISDVPSGPSLLLLPKVNWYQTFAGAIGSLDGAGERITGPMALFNRVLYFSTYQPTPITQTTACNGGQARIYAEDFFTPATGSAGTGGLGDVVGCQVVQGATGAVQFWVPGSGTCAQLPNSTDVIPGVNIQFNQSCAASELTNQLDYFTNSLTHLNETNITGGGYSLTFGKTGSAAGGTQTNLSIPNPTLSTIVDSWATVVE